MDVIPFFLLEERERLITWRAERGEIKDREKNCNDNERDEGTRDDVRQETMRE